MKVIIAGSRNFEDYNTLSKVCDHLLQNQRKVKIVSGAAADSLGEQYAHEKEFPVKAFPADWTKHGKAAEPIRNEEMAKYDDALIAFWDGKSSGTKSMISLANYYRLKIKVHYFMLEF